MGTRHTRKTFNLCSHRLTSLLLAVGLGRPELLPVELSEAVRPTSPCVRLSTWVAPRPGRFYPHKRSAEGSLDRLQSRCGRRVQERNVERLPGMEPRTFFADRSAITVLTELQ
jgi:hypothetical protein